MRIRRAWYGMRFAAVCWLALTVTRAQEEAPSAGGGQSSSQTTASPQASLPSKTDAGEIQAEVGDRDITYLRTRAVFRYDYKEQDGPTETNKFRLKLLYAFGPHQRMGASVEVPVMWQDTATGTTVFGSGDTEVTAGVNVYYREGFRTGFAGQVTFQTASEQALGGASTKLKGSWGLTWVVTSRFEFTGAFSYKQSVHIARGGPTKQFEPDVTLNARAFKGTWFVESDSYYDFIPEQFAPMIKAGWARGWGETKSWTTSGYIEWPLNSYARMTQHHLDVGLDVTWYPFRGH